MAGETLADARTGKNCRQAQRAHEEGVIAKRAAGLYSSGKRTREWLKFKAVHEQEVVIVGYTEPRRSRRYFGSLVLAVRDKAKKRWLYVGRVGTGFDQAALKSLYETMQPLRICLHMAASSCPLRKLLKRRRRLKAELLAFRDNQTNYRIRIVA